MEEILDVIIVGAGFAGLSAALELKRGGLRVHVLEARDHVGGRVESRLNGLGERIDTGGQFCCDDMPNVMSLLAERRHRLVSPSFEGNDVSIPPATPGTLAQIGMAAMAIRERYNAMMPDDPTIAGLSVAAWLDRQPESDAEKAAFRSMIEGLWCMALERLPLWHLIDNDRRVTNEQYELQYFPLDTMHALAEDLAGDLGGDVRLKMAAEHVAHDARGVNVRTGSTVTHARAVLVATPPAMAARLAFSPALPGPLANALSAWRSGAVIKMILRYRKPFWREKGLSGVVMWRDPAGLFACDTGSPGKATLSAFLGGPLALSWRERGLAWVQDQMLSQLAEALGPEAAAPLDIVVRDWVDDRWSGGAYGDLIVEIAARDAEAVITAGAPPLFFACSEISPSFPGYIEGAIIAGRKAAERMQAWLATQSASATSASGS